MFWHGFCRFFELMNDVLWRGFLVLGIVLVGFSAGLSKVHAQSQAVYTDSLQNSWQNWSWGSVLDFNNATVYHSGTKAISVTITNNYVTNTWGAIYLHHSAFDSSSYSNLTFWIHGGTSGGQQLQVAAQLNGSPQTSVALAPLVANTWQQIVLPLSSLGVANQPNLDGFWIQESVGTPLPTFYLDDVSFAAGSTPTGTNGPATITIDAAANVHAISPLIYGLAFATSNQLADLNVPLNRSGGNSETRYNWQLNAHNHAADWYFESLADSSATPGAAADEFMADSRNGGAQAMLTVPMIGWLPKLGPSRARLSSYSISKYGSQSDNDWQWFPDAGNGVRTNGTLITTNNPTDANLLTNSAFQQLFVQHLTNSWGTATNGGPRYYIMDNEHTLWFSTHRDVHPIGTTMREMRDNFFDYAAKVKGIDPSALVAGMEEWGWSGYFYSGYDQQWAGANNDYNPAHFPDRSTNGGWDYMPWFLDQARQRATNTNQRLLDIFTTHIYPQSGEFGNDTSTAMQLTRNRSTRSLWDTNYVDPSWIASVIKLIPRMKSWVSTWYPGTKIGITEYNWGAEGHINGATVQADILGIFGREGLDLATRWTTPDASTPTYKAIKLFRSYDGAKSGFGDLSVTANAPSPDNVSCFAAQRSADGSLTIMAINKQLTNAAPMTFAVTNFPAAGTAEVWQLSSANTIAHLANVSFQGNSFSNTLPAQTITLFVLAEAVPPTLRAGGISTSNSFDLWIDGLAGQKYVVQSSSNFANWIPVVTNSMASNSLHVLLPPPLYNQRFYRARWVP
jgi:hypothetical protein